MSGQISGRISDPWYPVEARYWFWYTEGCLIYNGYPARPDFWYIPSFKWLLRIWRKVYSNNHCHMNCFLSKHLNCRPTVIALPHCFRRSDPDPVFLDGRIRILIFYSSRVGSGSWLKVYVIKYNKFKWAFGANISDLLVCNKAVDLGWDLPDSSVHTGSEFETRKKPDPSFFTCVRPWRETIFYWFNWRP